MRTADEIRTLTDDVLLDTREAALLLNVNHGTLIRWRNHGPTSLRYHRIGTHLVKYRLGDVRAFIANSVENQGS